MALNKIPNPPTALIDDADWTTFVSRSGYGMIGHGLSIPIFTLTQWESGALIPEIATGSIIEVGGSFYQADSDTALTADTGLIDGTVRIKLVPAGGGATVIPTITSDALPSWSAPKGGWYDSDDKFLPHIMTKSGTSYTGKGVSVLQDANIKFFIDGDANFPGAVTVGGALNVGSGAVFNGALSGITNLTASGDLFTGKVRTRQIDVTGLTLTTSPQTVGTVSKAAIISAFWRGPGTFGAFTLTTPGNPGSTVRFSNHVRVHSNKLDSGKLEVAEYFGGSPIPSATYVELAVSSGNIGLSYSGAGGVPPADCLITIIELI